MQRQVPLIYLYGLVPGRYMPVWPVYVVHDDPTALAFTIAVDERRAPLLGPRVEDSVEADARRRYVTRSTRQRLHQQSFRERVLAAYQASCAICRLRHDALLEAAHILPDGHPRGEPIVPNGLALCKLHHAAFDAHLLGVNPDLAVIIRPDVLQEPDGPMLVHGLQEFHGARIVVPRSASLRPNREFLAERFALFQEAN
jgi:putative restriction endonuclease